MIPGVEAVSLATGLPPVRPINADDTDIEGYVKKRGGPDQNVSFYQGVSCRLLRNDAYRSLKAARSIGDNLAPQMRS